MTRRKVIADEILWRAGQSDTKWEPLAASIRESSRGVLGSEIRRNLLPPGPPPIKIAGTYRSLRKGREDEKDAAGAADFYYGEMEMRRKAAGLRTVEGWLITAYWLFSGYALRAWRAFAVLALLVALCALVFTAWGFDRSPKEGGIGKVDLHTGQVTYTPELPSTGIWAGVVYGAQSATSLLRAPEAKDLTPVGEAIEAFLRVFGPTLVAFGVLALRGRVKR
jgi:hypothetical protein